MTIELDLRGWFRLSHIFINIVSLISLSRMSWCAEISHGPSGTARNCSSLRVGSYKCHPVSAFWSWVCLIRAGNSILKKLNPPQTLIPVAPMPTNKRTSRHARCTLCNSIPQALETSTWPEQSLNSQNSFLPWLLILEVDQDGPLVHCRLTLCVSTCQTQKHMGTTCVSI